MNSWKGSKKKQQLISMDGGFPISPSVSGCRLCSAVLGGAKGDANFFSKQQFPCQDAGLWWDNVPCSLPPVLTQPDTPHAILTYSVQINSEISNEWK